MSVNGTRGEAAAAGGAAHPLRNVWHVSSAGVGTGAGAGGTEAAPGDGTAAGTVTAAVGQSQGFAASGSNAGNWSYGQDSTG